MVSFLLALLMATFFGPVDARFRLTMMAISAFMWGRKMALDIIPGDRLEQLGLRMCLPVARMMIMQLYRQH